MTHDRRLEGPGKEFLEFVDLVEPIAGPVSTNIAPPAGDANHQYVREAQGAHKLVLVRMFSGRLLILRACRSRQIYSRVLQ